ncbi:hypothetical protein ACIRVI_00625 [[Kitasatospora] papulosa]|uniref:Uncharacterized protein n=1 Tax=[Kitasatospora] papulosa TaxID=1464011 RepID=A0ABZ1JUJ4_9ACTN|nr:hypothetical protein [Streptomyces sp. NRRL S-325]
MSTRWENLVNEVLDRASDVGRSTRDTTRRALTGKKKKKEKTRNRKLAQRNIRAMETLAVQLDRYIKHDQAKQQGREAG